MSVLEKAFELGQEILASEEMKNMKTAEEAMMQDPEAQKIIQEFDLKQQEFLELQNQGLPLTEAQKQEVTEMEELMYANPLIYSYFQAQQKFEQVLEEINHLLSHAIGGHDSCDDECCSTCGSSCGH